MSNNLKFEFDFDEVFEGIKQGVIRELAETNFSGARDSVINQLKSEIKNEIRLTYKDEYELKDEIKKEIKDKVFNTLLNEAKDEYKKLYGDFFDKQLLKGLNNAENEVAREIKSKTIEKLYNDLYSSIQYEMNKNIKSVVAQLVNNLGGKNQMITKEEYDNLVHRSETLEALEQGGVDNWEWYGESIQQYFGNDEED